MKRASHKELSPLAHCRTALGVWLSLAALPLLSLTAFAACILLGPEPRIDTGDPLLDDFLAAFRQLDQDDPGYWGITSGFEDLRSNSAVFESLTPEWGEDARYWLLRAQFDKEHDGLLVSKGSIAGSWLDLRRQGQAECVAQALKYTPDDPALLLAAVNLQQSVVDFQASNAAGLAINSNSSEDEVAAFIKARARTARELPDTQSELLDRLERLMPDNALPDYLRALHTAELQDYGQTRAALLAGNRKPACVDPGTYPGTHFSEMLKSHEFDQDRLLLRLLARNFRGDIGSLRGHESMCLKVLLSEAMEQDDRVMLQAVYVSACRMVRARPEDEHNARRWLRVAKESCELVSSKGQGKLSADELARLSALSSRITAVSNSLGRLQYKSYATRPGGFSIWLTASTIGLLDARPYELLEEADEYDSWKQIQAGLPAILMQIEELQRFSFETMDWQGAAPAFAAQQTGTAASSPAP